jgi:iron complex transport system substrate-binding protein
MKKSLAALVAAFVLFAACGSDSSKSSTASESSANPERIVSMSPTATEMLFAIGAGQQVIAVDDQSNFPADVPKTDLSAYEPNVEAIAGYKPDLVVIADDTKDLKSQLETLNIPVSVEPAATTLDESYAQITELGDKSGHRQEADRLVTEMKKEIADLTKTVPQRPAPLTYYHELDNTLFSVTSQTFIGQLYTLAGLQNVADPADADGQSGGYPQLSAEFLVQANPDLVFLADTKCCAQDAAAFGARPGFGGLQAVQGGHVIPLDDDIASRWGPRVVDFLRTVVDSTKSIAPT